VFIERFELLILVCKVGQGGTIVAIQIESSGDKMSLLLWSDAWRNSTTKPSLARQS